MRKVIITLFSLFLILLLVAQEKTGRIIGNVVDTDGNPIPGVTVTLFPTAGPLMETIIKAEGSFRFLALPPSTSYAIKAELLGFKTVIEIGIIVVIGQTTRIHLEMEMGELVEVVVTDGGIEHLPTKEQIEAIRSAKTVRILYF